MEPITRKEMFLAKAAGQSVDTPEPITREEMFLQKIAENGGSGSTGGSASIDVTASVGQTIVVEEVDENGKPTKWRAAEYQERTHWSEYANTVLVDNQDINNNETIFDFLLVAGQSYHIVFNGMEYDGVARAIDFSGLVMIILGNEAIMGLEEDTGEPFLVQSVDGMGTVPTSADGSNFTLTLSTVKETINKLPTKYIPDEVAAYAPYYITVFEGDDGEGGKIYTAAVTPAPLEAMIDAGRQVIAKVQASNVGTIYLQFCQDVITADGKRRFAFWGAGYGLALTPNNVGLYDCEFGPI